MALVGQPYHDALSLRDEAGAPVSNATIAVAFARRQDGQAIVVPPIAESPPASGLYPFAFTPAVAQAHHLWLTAYKAPGFRQHWAATIWPQTAPTPYEHVVAASQEELLVLVDPAGVPVAGAAFAVVAGSVISPVGDPFAPSVVATSTAGAYLVRFTPIEPGYRRAELVTTLTPPGQWFVVSYDVGTTKPATPPVWTPLTNRGSVTWYEGGLPMAALSIRRGDTEGWSFVVRDGAGAIQNLSGGKVWWTVRSAITTRPEQDLPDDDAIMRAWWHHNGSSVVTSGVTGPDDTLGGTFASPNLPGGEMALTLLPDLTTTLPLTGSSGQPWRYDVQISFGPDDIRTVDEGTVQVIPDITRRETMP